MNAPMPPRCALASLIVGERDPEERRRELEEMKREGYRIHGILVIDLADPAIRPIERQVFEAFGRRRYGENRG